MESLHQPLQRRERVTLRFRRVRLFQKVAAICCSVQNHFNAGRNLSSQTVYKADRAAALTEWRAPYPA